MSEKNTTSNSLVGNAVGLVGRVLHSKFHMPGLHHGKPNEKKVEPGSMPGIEGMLAGAEDTVDDGLIIQCIDYSVDRVDVRDIANIETFLAEPRPDWVKVRWININGLSVKVVDQCRQSFGFHTLSAEDVMNTRQRSKVEPYDDHHFLVARMIMMQDEKLHTEQVSMFMYRDTLITFQEDLGDVWDPIRTRIHRDGSRLRQGQTGYLLYTLLDAIVDHCFPILEKYGDILEVMETKAVQDPSPELLQELHTIRRELLMLRRLLWPMREMVDRLVRDEEGWFTENARTYLRDVYDHVMQIVDIVETYREMAAGISDLYMTSMSNRMNEVMKVLTIMASLFIPITFLAGVYGMNFEHIPELAWMVSYPIFWTICISVIVGMILFFRRKGWVGGKFKS